MEIFAVLGPNGGGKSTLFHILSTLISPTSGVAHIFGQSVTERPAEVRKQFGVVFQSPSLDKRLTVQENLYQQGRLFGLRGADLKSRVDRMLEKFSLADRRKDFVDTLSGGLARRAEIAKCLLHSPKMLLMDEPSTGLDPAIRMDLWKILEELRAKDGVTIVLTTHWMEEAERCDRVAILNRGALVAIGTPTELKKKVSGDVILLETSNADDLANRIQEKMGLKPKVVDGRVSLEHERGTGFLTELFTLFSGDIAGVTVRKPTLDDVFLKETGAHLMDGASQ